MHLLKYVAIGFAILGLTLLIARRTWVAGAACVALSAFIVAVLFFAEPTVCEALGGESLMNGGYQVCRNEWGGNGNNDPGNGLSFPD